MWSMLDAEFGLLMNVDDHSIIQDEINARG